jgi:Flp pilus assembly protein TadD
MRHPASARTIAVPLAAALIASFATGCASSRGAETVAAQLDFGVQMAERGLWSEALFRFEQANRLEPGDQRVLNDLAVSYEAVGRFDDALATYKKALETAPDNRRVRQNYTRFLEFYQSFRAKRPAPGEPAPQLGPPSTPPPGGAGGGR